MISISITVQIFHNLLRLSNDGSLPVSEARFSVEMKLIRSLSLTDLDLIIRTFQNFKKKKPTSKNYNKIVEAHTNNTRKQMNKRMGNHMNHYFLWLLFLLRFCSQLHYIILEICLNSIESIL